MCETKHGFSVSSMNSKISIGLLGNCMLELQEVGKWSHLLSKLESMGFALVTCKSKESEFHIDIEYVKHSPNLAIHLLNSPKKKLLIRIEPEAVLPAQYSKLVEMQYGYTVDTTHKKNSASATIIWQNGFLVDSDFLSEKVSPNIGNRVNAIGIVNQNKFSFVKGNMYATRQRVMKKVSMGGLKVILAGKDWDMSIGLQLKSQIRLMIKTLKYRSLLNLRELHLPISKSSTNLVLAGFVTSEVDFLSRFKFALVIENEKTYLSEKLFNALLAGCIPIYIGPELTKFKLPRGIAIEIHEPLAETILTRTTELSEESALVMIENIRNFLKDPVAFNYWSINQGLERLSDIIFDFCAESAKVEYTE